MLSFATVFFAASVAGSALPQRQATDNSPVFFPLKYPYNGYPKVYTEITFGTPGQTPIQAVVDLGSANFWTYAADASIFYGSNRLGEQGSCVQVPSPAYNVSASSSAADEIYNPRDYVYGGNSKTITALYSWNETLAFGVDGVAAAGATLENQQVAVSNKSLVRQLDTECAGIDYDGAILGVSEAVLGGGGGSNSTAGPSFRQNLLDGGRIASSTLSMWFDRAPSGVNDTFHGSALFGAVPTSKYRGRLTRVPKRQPANSIGYYVDAPVWSATRIDGSSSSSSPRRVIKRNGDATSCLIDSGSGQDYLPIDRDDFLDATGLVLWQSSVAFNGSCEDMPRNGTLSVEFAGAGAGAGAGAAANGTSSSVTVEVPLMNYVRGSLDVLSELSNVTMCGLSMTLNEPGDCTLGSPFTSAAFMAFNDELGEIAIAQGGVSSGSLDGAEGLGEIVVIGKGEGLGKVAI
ncbi:aspartic peptidase domain-containing protein [Xylariaceae sp. FL0804]|nr:aspartic peptidase domain-containing protein [Xylariaceae sp. FL0804]